MVPKKPAVSLPEYQWGWISVLIFEKEQNITITLKQKINFVTCQDLFIFSLIYYAVLA